MRICDFFFFFVAQNLVQPAVITQSAYLLIAAGAFIFIVSFLGYCGAVKESRVLLGLVGIWLMNCNLYINGFYFCHLVRRLRLCDCGLGDYRRKSGSDLPTGGNISLAPFSFNYFQLIESIHYVMGGIGWKGNQNLHDDGTERTLQHPTGSRCLDDFMELDASTTNLSAGRFIRISFLKFVYFFFPLFVVWVGSTVVLRSQQFHRLCRHSVDEKQNVWTFVARFLL